jgi:hypothetical protein
MPNWTKVLVSIWIGLAITSVVYFFIAMVIAGSWTGAFFVTAAVIALIAYKDLGV